MLLLLSTTVLGLSSCKLMRKNYNVVADRVAPAQADDVMVENSGALPPIAPPAAGTGAPLAPTAAGRVITVQRGDTLSAIARRYGTTVAALCAANGTTPTTPIRVGQKLRLPGGGNAAAYSHPQPQGSPHPTSAARSYTVKRGDTISGIAARHGISTAALLRANKMTSQQTNRIREGQKLSIPAR